jgi:formylglycine-generating enzyme required for sulfatase activity
MNDEILTQVRSMVERFGPEVVLDVRRCEGLLRDLCAHFPRELNVLLAGLRAGIPQELHRTPVDGRGVAAARLARKLEDEYAMAADAASWAVNAWVSALGGARTSAPSPSASNPSRGGSPPLVETAASSASRRARIAERVERMLDEAADHEHRGEWSVAVEVYDDVLVLDPGHAEAQRLRALAVRRRDRSVSSGPASMRPAFQQTSTPAPLPRTIAPPAAPPGYVQISAGQFTMGSPPTEENRSDDETQHLVTITRSFWLKATPVTQAEYEALMGTNPSHFKSGEANCPVENVSWLDAVAYVNKLSDREGLPRAYDANGGFAGLDCRGYRLPTEAEWEYACRAGSSAARYGDLDQVAWYKENAGSTTRPVAQKRPNAWGLYDMLGNVWEWTNDWYGFYPTGAVTDPVGPASAGIRVVRGGSWFSFARFVRAAHRRRATPFDRDLNLGFRPLRAL